MTSPSKPTTKRTPPPPPPRKVATPTTTPTNRTVKSAKAEPYSEGFITSRDAIIAAGEFAHASMRKPRASSSHVAAVHRQMMHAVSDEVMKILTSNTDADRICDLVAAFVGHAAQQGFKLGVQHGMAS